MAQCEGVSRSNRNRWASIGRLRAIAGPSGGGMRRSWSSRGGDRLRLTGVCLTSVPGVDLASSEVRRHQHDMSNPLGVPSRVYDASSKVRNGGADLGAGNSSACDVSVPGWSTASKI